MNEHRLYINRKDMKWWVQLYMLHEGLTCRAAWRKVHVNFVQTKRLPKNFPVAVKVAV